MAGVFFANTTAQAYPTDGTEAARLLAAQVARPVEFVAQILNTVGFSVNEIAVALNVSAETVKCQRAIARLGAKEEGTLRNHMIAPGGRIRDSVLFSVIDSEWPQVKVRLEGKLERGAKQRSP